jgi:hypothetical protein
MEKVGIELDQCRNGESSMGQGLEEYRGHHLELHWPEERPEAEPELLIDGEPMRYGQLPDGRYALEEYAYDWHDNLMDLARSYIDYRIKTDWMEQGREDYRGHHLELRWPDEGFDAKAQLLIDGEPMRYGQLPDGRYALEEYAYDWHDNLMDLARSYVDYRDKTGEIWREREQGSVE